LPRCEIIRRDHVVDDIPNFGGDERIKFVITPGIRLNPPEK